ncbi:hypothetical protein OFB78_30870, partial [Escherichia coli]|nr:hypothetical protein [Escherichia coli]
VANAVCSPSEQTFKPLRLGSTLADSGKSRNIPFVSDHQTPETLLFSWDSVRSAHGSGREWG